jgi:predicted Zn-dependent protease
MKLLRNSLLLCVSVLLPTTTAVVAETMESRSPTDVIVISEPLPTREESISTPVETIVIPDVIPVEDDVPEVTGATEAVEAEAASEAVTNAEEVEVEEEIIDTEEDAATATEEEPALSPEEIARQEKLIEADRLYINGQTAAAQKLYREAKTPFETEAAATQRPEPIYEPSQLSPAGSVYWRQSTAGLEQNLQTKVLVPLQLLVEQYPEFIPGHLRYAQALKKYGRKEDSLEVLEQATNFYPYEPELLKAKIVALGEEKKWLEASLAARQFALFNITSPQADEFAQLADQNLERYQSHLRADLRGSAIANAITGVLGYVVTGNLFGPISAVQTTTMLLRGESAVGESIANRAQRQLTLVEDEQVLEYVQEIGNKLATVAGRSDFEYEFHVVADDRLNAFALPGGKIFVNAGAIMKTKSEAELAGLLAHELSHAVLSHGFQLATQGNLIANVTQYFPLGGTAANLIVFNYNRDMERQADALGTRILVSSGYSADGMRNLMVTLNEEDRTGPVFAWLSTHPNTEERIRNLESAIVENGYNRYAYEGVERHREIQKRVATLLKEHEERQEE